MSGIKAFKPYVINAFYQCGMKNNEIFIIKVDRGSGFAIVVGLQVAQRSLRSH